MLLVRARSFSRSLDRFWLNLSHLFPMFALVSFLWACWTLTPSCRSLYFSRIFFFISSPLCILLIKSSSSFSFVSFPSFSRFRMDMNYFFCCLAFLTWDRLPEYCLFKFYRWSLSSWYLLNFSLLVACSCFTSSFLASRSSLLTWYRVELGIAPRVPSHLTYFFWKGEASSKCSDSDLSSPLLSLSDIP